MPAIAILIVCELALLAVVVFCNRKDKFNDRLSAADWTMYITAASAIVALLALMVVQFPYESALNNRGVTILLWGALNALAAPLAWWTGCGLRRAPRR